MKRRRVTLGSPGILPGYIAQHPSPNDITYDGQGHELCTAGSGSGTMLYSEDGVSFSSSIPTEINAGTYTVYYKTDSSPSYTESNVYQITCTIDKAAGSVLSAPTNKSVTYNGSAQDIINAGSGTGTMYYRVGDSGDFSTTIPKQTNASNSYTVYYYAAESSNYAQSSTSSVTATIGQKEVTLTWGTASWTYDKTAHSTTCTAGSLVSGDSCTVNLTGNSITNKGTTTVTASSLSNSNYKLPSANTKTLTISARTVTLTWGTVTWTYDKTAHSTTCTAGNLCSGDSCTVTLTGNSITNKGTATVTASSLSNSNYALPSSKTNTLTVNARTVTLTWGTITWTYDRAAHSTTCTAGNLCSGDSCTVTLTGNSITNKGTTTVTASSLSNSNYALPSAKTKTLTINARTVTLSWGTVTWTYDGSAHSTTCTAGNVCSGDTCTVTLTGNSVGANKGTATVTASSLSNSNYALPSSKTATLTINARSIKYTATNESFAYDGKSHSASNTATLSSGSLASGQTATFSCSGSVSGNAGSSATKTLSSVTIKSGSTDVSSNYSITKANGTLSIVQATGSASVSGVTKTYNPGVAYDLISVSSNTGTMHYRLGTSGSWTTTKPGTGQAGTYTVYYYMDATTNYTARGSSSSPWGSVSSTINKATGSVTVTGLHQTSSGALVSVSSQNTGTMHYRVGSSGSWSTSIPTSSTADLYTVYYYSDASTNYTGVGSSSSPKSVAASVGEVFTAPSSVTFSGTSGSYELTNYVGSRIIQPTVSSKGSKVTSATVRQKSGSVFTISFKYSGSSGTQDTITVKSKTSGKTVTTTVKRTS